MRIVSLSKIIISNLKTAESFLCFFCQQDFANVSKYEDGRLIDE